MAVPSFIRILRPKTFFHFVSLLTATEFITLSLLVNKVSGLYGILALFTGYHLSVLQLSMYIYSIVIFGLVCYLGPHIRKQSPLQNLVLAWIYILDTAINAAYTALFGLGWFIMLAQHLNPSRPDAGEDTGSPVTPPGGKMINDTAGFTNPEEGPVDKVEIIATPRPDKALPGQDAVAYPSGDGSSLGNAVFQSGSIMSISVISVLWFIRLYFVLIVMAYARQVLRQTIAATPSPISARKSPKPDDAGSNPASPALGSVPTEDRNPFDATLPHGQGWQGRLGRALIKFPKAYWLGVEDGDEEWVRGADERFRTRRSRAEPLIKSPAPPRGGTGERERRARSGTGPPPPGLDVASPGLGVGNFPDRRRSGEGEGRKSGERSD